MDDKEDRWMEEMERDDRAFDFWRLCDELTIFQAALLTIFVNPSGSNANCESWSIDQRPAGYEAAKTAICNALRKGIIKGKIVFPITFTMGEHEYENKITEDSIDIFVSRVEVDSLRSWLSSRGFKTGFFFPATTMNEPDYLDPKNPRYAPKLAAAVSAWQAVTDSGNKSPKQALDKWLREHAAKFGLTDEDGNPVNQAIEDCSKVANWSQSGGAPKTPSR